VRWETIKLLSLMLFAVIAVAGSIIASNLESKSKLATNREEVLFWHFWGGADRAIVEDVAHRFNESQQEFFVRPIAMPGNNLDLKFYLSVTGGDPPDLLNIDDPIIADWGKRGAIHAIDEVAPEGEVEQLRRFLFPAARRLVEYQDRMYGVPNGLDIRAMYCNKTLLDQYDLPLPETTEQLDRIAVTIAPPDQTEPYERHGYLPDSRRLWAWGPVFGGSFYIASREEVTLDSPEIAQAFAWMESYRNRYGANEIERFRHGDQSLPGKTFPLFAGRYAVVMDGQWRVRDIRAFQKMQEEKGEPVTQFEVVPLPYPTGGRKRAGWVNGNNFVIPKGAREADGAWEFIKFWCGMNGQAGEAAKTCAAGGWIPVSQQVVDHPTFDAFLDDEPLFRKFVELAGSENQYPVPVIPGAAYFNSEVKSLVEKAMSSTTAPHLDGMLQDADARIQAHIDRAKED